MYHRLLEKKNFLKEPRVLNVSILQVGAHASGLPQNYNWNGSQLQLRETPGKWSYCYLKLSIQNWKQAKPPAWRVWGKTQISHSESFHWLPVRLQVTCRWSHLISRRSKDKAEKSLFSVSWYFSICFFHLQFLNFYALDSVWHFPEIIPSIKYCNCE